MANDLNNSQKPSAAVVAARAFELWEREGRQQGRDVDYWLQAEAELTLRNRATQSANSSNNSTETVTASAEDSNSKARRGKSKKQTVTA